ncbi:MAG: preprotein translocase subunit TatC [Gammaproteobacteria bacterium]|nr:preprotein translocase subunit TatC [Gammaproteobacteria bacterium]
MQHLEKAYHEPIPTISWENHWRELKIRCVRSIFVLLSLFTFFLLKYQSIWACIFYSLRFYFPELKLVSRTLSGPFLLTVKISFLLSIIVTFFWISHEVWSFVQSGLTNQEKKAVRRLLSIFCILFIMFQYIGVAWLVPITMTFFVAFNQGIVEKSVDITDIVEYTLTIQFALLIVTLWPFLLKIALRCGWATYIQLKKLRPWIYVMSFFIGMILTPPDVVAQFLIALPLIVLYEGTLIL